MSDRPNNHGYAAWEQADVSHAKRGRPDFDLRGYADERGLEFLDRADPPLAGWKQALPRFPQYAPFKTGHADTPPEGVPDTENGLVFEARDGIGLMWSKPSWGWKWAYDDDFPQRAAALADSRGLYA